MRYLAVFIVLMVAYVPAYSQAFENDHVQLIFDPASFALTSLVDKDNAFSVSFYDQIQVPLWRLVVMDTLAEPPYVWSRDFKEVWATQVTESRSYFLEQVGAEQILHLYWTDFSLPYGGLATVSVEVRLPDDSSESQWNISVATTGQDALWRVDFPVLVMEPIDGNPDDDMAAVPIHSGLLVRNPHLNAVSWIGDSELRPEAKVSGSHPGIWEMQWMQIYDENSLHGLLLRSTDSIGYAKGISMFPNPYGLSTVMMWQHYPENNTMPDRSYSPSYDVRLQPFLGDWFDAAKVYRSWLLAQTWSSGGPIETRIDFPQATAESLLLGLYTDLVPTVFTGVQDVVDSHQRWQEFFGEGMLITHLRGAKIGLWAQLPDPTKLLDDEDVNYLVSALNNLGIRSAPYTNTHGWPQSIPDDGELTLDASLARTLNGEGYYSLKFNEWKTCPAAEPWRQKYLDITNVLVEIGSTDQYCDLYSTVRLCFDVDHGHPLGGGSWWINGYRTQMQAARKAARSVSGREDFLMAPEHRSETGIGLFDAYILNYWTYGGEAGSVFRGGVTTGIPTPIVAATIHDYIGSAGSMGVPYSNIRHENEIGSQHFRFAQGFNLVHGNFPGFYHEKAPEWPDVDGDELRDLEYLRSLAHHRLSALKFLLYGEYLRPPDTGSGTQFINMDEEDFVQPVILGGAFRSSDGSLGVFMTNYNLDSRTADFTISNEDYALGNSTYEVYSFSPDGREFYGGFRGSDYVRKWIFSALDILMLEVTSTADTDGDGMSNSWELLYGLDPNNSMDASGDIDTDGLSNREEFQNGCNPGNSDTDGDGVLDPDEVAQGTDPRYPIQWTLLPLTLLNYDLKIR